MSAVTNDKRKLAGARDRASVLQAVESRPGLVISELASITGMSYFRVRAFLTLLQGDDKVHSRRQEIGPKGEQPRFAAHIYPGVAPERSHVLLPRGARREPLVAALFGPGPAASC